LKQSNKLMEEKFRLMCDTYAGVLGLDEFGVFSETFKDIIQLTQTFHSDRSVPVLIEGETGTGKEIVAKMVHYGRNGTTAPFIPLNCSAISPSLFESELFGYEDGAFTGARKGGMIGKLDLAQGGTLFLDEIGEMPLELQPKLLRVLQEKEFYRIGGKKRIKMDVRIICATNRDLRKEMEKKLFRPDLYYRLNTGKLFLPALRYRREEIKPMAQMFLNKFAAQKKRKFKLIEEEALEILKNYNWPGNIRELENAIERVVLLHDETELRKEFLAFILNQNGTAEEESPENIPAEAPFRLIIDFPEEGLPLKEIVKTILNSSLKKFNGNKTRTAKFLGISLKTIYNKLNE